MSFPVAHPVIRYFHILFICSLTCNQMSQIFFFWFLLFFSGNTLSNWIFLIPPAFGAYLSLKYKLERRYALSFLCLFGRWYLSCWYYIFNMVIHYPINCVNPPYRAVILRDRGWGFPAVILSLISGSVIEKKYNNIFDFSATAGVPSAIVCISPLQASVTTLLTWSVLSCLKHG